MWASPNIAPRSRRQKSSAAEAEGFTPDPALGDDQMEATKSETNIKQAVPFFAVSNMEDSLRFYVDGLGFEMTHKWIDEGTVRWCMLQREGAALMLQDFRREQGESWSPEGKLGLGVSIMFICDDALAIYRELSARRIQASRPFVGNGDVGRVTARSRRLQDRVRELHGRARRTRCSRKTNNEVRHRSRATAIVGCNPHQRSSTRFVLSRVFDANQPSA